MREIRFSNRAKLTTLWIIAGFAGLLLWRTAPLLAPFVWAIIATYIFHPLVTFMTRQTGIPRGVWVALLYVTLGAVVAFALVRLGPVLRDQVIALVTSAPAALDQVQRFLDRQPVLLGLGVRIDLTQAEREVQERAADITGLAERVALPVVGIVTAQVLRLGIFLVTTFYLLLNAENIMAFFIGLAPQPYQHEIEGLLRRINRTLGAYLRSQLLLIAIMGGMTFVFLSAVGVEYALVLALLTGALELVPFVGPLVAGAVAVSVALFQPTTPYGWSNLTLALVVGLGYLVLRHLEDYVVIPTVLGRVVHLNPVIVMFSLVAGASFAGILGVLIAVPVAAVVGILGEYVYTKLLSREAPQVVPIGAADDPLALVSEAAQTGAKRLIVVNVNANAALREARTYQAIAHLIDRNDLDVTFISSDAVACGLAQTHGMRLASNAI